MGTQPKELLRAIGLGLLAPMLIAPVAWVVLLLLSRLVPMVGAHAFAASGALFDTLIPDIGHKGLLVPILTLVGPPILIGDLGAAVLTWRAFGSVKLVGVSLAASLGIQIAFVVAAWTLLVLAG